MKLYKHIFPGFMFILFSLLSLIAIISCKGEKKLVRNNGAIISGDICSVENGDGTFGIIKVLVIDDSIAHLRIYKNKYPTRPKNIDVNTLILGSIYDKDGFGIGHTPLDRKGFDNWKPHVLINKPVTEEELEGYNIWRDQ